MVATEAHIPGQNPATTIECDPRSDERKPTNFQKCYNSPKASDITIYFADKRIFAHKETLATWSWYFQDAFASPYLHFENNELWLFDDDTDALEGMLMYIYGMPLPLDGPLMSLDIVEREFRLYKVAKKYGVLNLRDNAVKTVKVFVGIRAMKGAKVAVADIRRIYEDTSPDLSELRDIVKDICHENFGEMLKTSDNTGFDELLLEFPALAKDLGETAQRGQVETA